MRATSPVSTGEHTPGRAISRGVYVALVFARPLAGRGNPEDWSTLAYASRSVHYCGDCFVARAMTYQHLPSLAGKVAAKPTDESSEG